jgi:hypothetical protein
MFIFLKMSLSVRFPNQNCELIFVPTHSAHWNLRLSRQNSAKSRICKVPQSILSPFHSSFSSSFLGSSILFRDLFVITVLQLLLFSQDEIFHNHMSWARPPSDLLASHWSSWHKWNNTIRLILCLSDLMKQLLEQLWVIRTVKTFLFINQLTLHAAFRVYLWISNGSPSNQRLLP